MNGPGGINQRDQEIANELLAELRKKGRVLQEHPPVENIDDPYGSLWRVYELAHDQAANGKGRERHADAGEPFERQKICEITRRLGAGYPLGQAIKKIYESERLDSDAAIQELLGAINYIAAAVIIINEG